MLYQLKVDLLQSPATYLLCALLADGLPGVMLCGLFVFARLIVPGIRPTLTPLPISIATLVVEAAYHCDQPSMLPPSRDGAGCFSWIAVREK